MVMGWWIAWLYLYHSYLEIIIDRTCKRLLVWFCLLETAMPRDACSVSGCTTVRTPGGLGIFRVSLLDDSQQQLWRDRIMNIMGSRVGGGEFNAKLSAGQALICERHFRDDDLITCEWLLSYIVLLRDFKVWSVWNFIRHSICENIYEI